MKKHILILAFFIQSVSIYPQDTKSIAQNILKSTVLITTKDLHSQILKLGSGFIIDNELIVTNLHVIEGAKSVYIKINDSKFELKSIGYVAVDKENDLIILKVPNLYGIPLSLSNTNPQIGEKIFVVGNPLGLIGTFSDGLISGIRTFNNRNLLQITAPISPGSSGGPVVNSNSELIGISVSGMKDGQNLNFCIPVGCLVKLRENIDQILPFNIKNHIEKPKSLYLGISNGVIVRDVKLCPLYSDLGSCIGRCIYSFSILNNLSQEVRGVKLLFIVYDSNGIPVDNYQDIISEVIPSKLAKRINNPYNVEGANIFKVMLHKNDRISIRVLNYYIIEE